MKTLSLRIPDDVAAALERQARETGQTKSDIARRALAARVKGEAAPDGERTMLEKMGDLVGCVSGPGDLSTNPKHLEGFGR
jgi:hypothetical protein